MRPVKSMIEFKQIVGRGTRLFDGKDHFTIFDFVEAHKHFQDPEWDGPPLPPEDPIERKPKKPSKFKEEEDTGLDNLDDEEPVKKMIKVTLADSTVREIDPMVKTTFWSPEGKPISIDELESLYSSTQSSYSPSWSAQQKSLLARNSLIINPLPSSSSDLLQPTKNNNILIKKIKGFFILICYGYYSKVLLINFIGN